MNTLYVDQLEIQTVIGNYAWERHIQQKVRISLEMDIDIETAILEEDFSKGVDYKKLIDEVSDFVTQSRCHLIETLAEAVAHLILENFPVREVRVDVSKPGICPQVRGVGVRITRPAVGGDQA